MRIFVAEIPVRTVKISMVASIVPRPSMALMYKAMPNEKTSVPNRTRRMVGSAFNGCIAPISMFEKMPVTMPLIKLPSPMWRRSMKNMMTKTMALKIAIMVPSSIGMCLVTPSRKVLSGSTPWPEIISKLMPIAIIKVPRITTSVFNENCFIFKFLCLLSNVG